MSWTLHQGACPAHRSGNASYLQLLLHTDISVAVSVEVHVRDVGAQHWVRRQCFVLQSLYHHPKEQVDEYDVGKCSKTPKGVLLQNSHCC